MIEIQLTKGYVAIVDEADRSIARHKWNPIAESGHPQPYAARRFTKSGGGKVVVLMHRLVMQRALGRPVRKDELVDHINGNSLDNRRENLRLATHTENMRNSSKHADGKCPYKGVSFCKHSKRNPWKAQIMADGVTHYLGLFPTPELAHEAYCTAGRKLHGEFFNPG